MKLSAHELSKLIVQYVEKNNVRGKARDSVAHAMAWSAAMVAHAEGATDFSGLCFVLSVRGYREAADFAAKTDAEVAAIGTDKAA
jgi:hypothetical protein